MYSQMKDLSGTQEHANPLCMLMGLHDTREGDMGNKELQTTGACYPIHCTAELPNIAANTFAGCRLQAHASIAEPITGRCKL